MEIANNTNLTLDRVRYICRVHEKIRCRMEKDLRKPEDPWKEEWGLREFVGS